MNQHETTVFHPYMSAREFPALSGTRLVNRPALIETIASLLNETPVLFLEGNEGCGATTTAAQFCMEYPDRTFALFIKAGSRITYSPDFIRLTLAEQYTQFLDQTSFDRDIIDESEFSRLQFRLRRKATRTRPFYFAIDGLHQIPADEDKAIEILLKDVLPIGWEHFKFLITGKQSQFASYLNKTTSRYYHQLKFSLSETRELLDEIGLKESDLNSIHKLCDGIPARLASVKRLVGNGVTIDEIFQSEPSKYLEFVKLEYARIDKLSPDAKTLLAILTFSNRKLTTQELLEVAKVTEAPLSELLSTFSFIQKSGATSEVDFVSEGHRRFAISILEDYKRVALSAQIEFLVANPQSHVALRFLPTYYQQAGQTEELVRLLSTDHFTNLLDSTSSILSLRNRAELGVKSASLLKQVTDVFSFSIKRSLFSSIARADAARSEIRALVALKRNEAAFALAQNSVIREERFGALCTYARQVVESGCECDPEVLGLIKETASLIDFCELGDCATDIATELVAVDASLALSIIVSATENSNDTAERQFAVARLAIAAREGSTEKTISSLNSASKSVSDEKMQAFLSEMFSLISTLSCEEVMSFVQTIDRRRRLPFLCSWASNHRYDESAVKVVEYALNYMIDDAAYNPKMQHLRDLALPIANATDRTEVESLIQRIDSQRRLIKDSSLLTDSTSLQMTLAQAELTFSQEKAHERISDTYRDLTNNGSVEGRLECLAIMLEALRLMDPDEQLGTNHKFKDSITSDLMNLLEATLRDSADHFQIVKGAVRALSNADLESALSICARLNLASRRDDAFCEAARALYENGYEKNTTIDVLRVIEHIDVEAVRYGELARFIRVSAGRKYSMNEASIAQLRTTIEACADVDWRCILTPLLVEIWNNAGCPGSSPSLERFDSDLNLVSATWRRIDAAFAMVVALAKTAPELAATYYDKASAYRSSGGNWTVDFHQMGATCLNLAARALKGALLSGCPIDDALDRFCRLVDGLPSLRTRIDLTSDLASKAWAADRTDVALRLLRVGCLPMIDGTLRTDPYLGRALIKAVFPPLYCLHPQLASTYAQKLSRDEYNSAAMEATDLILRRETRSDPALDDVVGKVRIAFADALSVVDLIKTLKDDNAMYWCINELCTSIVAKVNKSCFTENQREDIATRLTSFFRENLPDQANIKHDGYLILCEACMLMLRDNARPSDWNDLACKARAIPNAADRGFVLYELSELAPSRLHLVENKLRQEAIAIFNGLPSLVDRINLLIQVSKNSKTVGVNIAKEQLRSAMLLTLQSNDDDLAKRSRRKIIDVAEKIGIDFANELSDLADQDPARASARRELKRRLQTLKIKRRLADAKSPDDVTSQEARYLPEAAWMNLTSLMAGRIEAKMPETMISYLEQSSAMPLSHAYPILAWHIENLCAKISKSKSGTLQMEALIEKTLLTCELSATLASKIAARESAYTTNAMINEKAQIGINNRESALVFLGQWLASCDSELLLCDPYFGPDEIDFFRLILANCPRNEITIITSKSFLTEKKALSAEAFQERWAEAMDQELPATRIIGVSYAEGSKAPIHDRWLISGQRGLRLGTSIGSIGTGKLSEISALDADEIANIEANLQRFVRGERNVDGLRVQYHSLTF